MDDLKDPEEKVRAYLRWLDDPSSVLDKERANELQQQLATVDDPIEKLALAAELHRVENPEVERLREDFIGVSKGFAADRDLPVGAFLKLGVPEADLERAGFTLATNKRHRHDNRKQRTTIADVADSLPAGDFTMRQLHEASGASRMTVRKAVQKLLADGSIENVGPDPDFSGPGRSPTTYRRVTSNAGRLEASKT